MVNQPKTHKTAKKHVVAWDFISCCTTNKQHTHVFFCTPAVFCFCSTPSAQFYPASFSCTERKPLGHCFSSFLFLQPPPLLNYSIRSFGPANTHTHTHIPYAATCQATWYVLSQKGPQWLWALLRSHIQHKHICKAPQLGQILWPYHTNNPSVIHSMSFHICLAKLSFQSLPWLTKEKRKKWNGITSFWTCTIAIS